MYPEGCMEAYLGTMVRRQCACLALPASPETLGCSDLIIQAGRVAGGAWSMSASIICRRILAAYLGSSNACML